MVALAAQSQQLFKKVNKINICNR